MYTRLRRAHAHGAEFAVATAARQLVSRTPPTEVVCDDTGSPSDVDTEDDLTDLTK